MVSVGELRGMIGKEAKVEVTQIEKGMIKKAAEAIGDPNPLWQDEKRARKTKYGGIIAPPGLLITAMMSGSRPEGSMPFQRLLAGGGEWEFLLPIRAGDVITSTTALADVYEREGKAGKMLFFIFETIHKNQLDEVVAKSRSTLINY